MLIRGVIHHKIDQHVNIALLGLGCEVIEIGECAASGGDVDVIRHIVPKVHLRRGVKGREPNSVYAQMLEVIEVRDYALRVAPPIIIRVRKAPRVDL